MPWYVLYVKPKSEKKTAVELEKLQIEVYCPLLTEVRQWSDRKKKVQVPLFNSYVFVNLLDGERKNVFEVHNVLRYLHWLGKPAIVRDEEIETLKAWLKNDNIEQINIDHLSEGDQITIAEGKFKGREATIIELGKNRLRLILKSLNCVVNIRTSEVVKQKKAKS